ncbi:glycosyltransferase family 2 protein [uncultured Dokdonia sp.]|uniref:glycosyltransferase family 2 protein n=1 Tax=uncultured Dokdonia sp. TaxID=575653 RepID=UPI0026270507|nr:glycosyltransferase family 2 protein [uncultured Dokdonia sp.]
MKTVISIIIPSYNRAHLIQETLNSVVAQSSPDWECIVVDDGSTDATVEVVTAFAKADSRIHLFQRDDTYTSGGNGARQMGLDRATSDWVMFLDSDDLLGVDCIKNRLASVEETIDMCVFHTASFKVEVKETDVYWNMLHKRETCEEYLMRFLYQDMPWHTTGVLWNAAFLKKIGGWNQELIAWQDWELHVRALTYNPRVKALVVKADNYYRLDVADSIATKKKSLEYLEAIKKAIESVEGKVLESNMIKEAKTHLRFLIYRNLIGYPIKWKQMKIPFQIRNSGIQFQSVSPARFLYAYWKERVFAITIIKRFLKNKCKLDYYKRMYPETTFLKKRM